MCRILLSDILVGFILWFVKSTFFFIENFNRVMKRTRCLDTTIFVQRTEACHKLGVQLVWMEKEQILKQLSLIIEV